MNEKSSAKKIGAAKNVVRYVGGSSYDSSTGEVDGGAFDRKPKDHDGLSFTVRLEIDSNDEIDKLKIKKIFSSRMVVGKTSIFAELNVGHVLAALDEFESDFYFYYDPLPEDGTKLENPAHAILHGLPFAGESAGGLKSEYAGDILKGQILNIFPAFLPHGETD